MTLNQLEILTLSNPFNGSSQEDHYIKGNKEEKWNNEVPSHLKYKHKGREIIIQYTIVTLVVRAAQ
jgi:TfoX/Sxy family transcriptional regulator of competence genes